MALAYKCDICDSLFESKINDLNEIELNSRYVENQKVYRNCKLTACPACINHIIKFINEHYKDENRRIKEVR